MPYALSPSDTSKPIIIDHTIRITVITECSQFGSNMNVIPILAEYPTMRVLMQNAQVSANNIHIVLKQLREGIDAFEKTCMGYELDVRDNHSQSITDSTETRFSSADTSSTSTNSTRNTYPRKASIASALTSKPSIHHQHKNHKNSTNLSKQSQRKNTLYNSKKTAVPTTANANATQSRPHIHHKSSSSVSSASKPQDSTGTSHSKDTWGVGKTGSTLSYILRAALFALELLPEDAQPSVILMTDGVVKSNIQDEAIVQEMVAKNIACNIVQLGKDMSFFPGLNFGFVPDNEILEFVASATNGTFTFSEYCTPVVDEYDGINITLPNMYHHQYLFKETILDSKSLRNAKSKDNRAKTLNKPQDSSASRIERISTRLNGTDLSTINTGLLMPQFDRKVFPWDPVAKPIVEESGRLKFKEYFLPSECWHFIHARLRQGFVLYSISFTDEPRPSSSKSSSAISRQLSSEVQPTIQKRQTVSILLVLRWQPNISVHYSIKSVWTSSLHAYLNSVSSVYDNIPEEPYLISDESMFSHIRAPKVDIIVKSSSTFSHMLHNWDSFQRRNQMMAVQGGNMTIDLAVGKMKRLLERIAESDTMLKQLVQFNFSEKNNISIPPNQFASANMTEWASQLSYVQKFSAHWAKLARSDLHAFNMLLETEQYASTFDELQHEIQTDFNYISTKLEKWATFINKVSKTVSSLDSNRRTSPGYPNSGSPKRHIVPQFCEVRVIRIMFFDTNAQLCKDITQELRSLLDTQSQYQKTLSNLEVRDPSSDTYINSIENDSENIKVSKRPVSTLLIRDSMHFLPALDNENRLSKPVTTNNKPSWYTKFIVKNYLNRCTWHWDSQDLYQDKHPYTTFLTPLVDLAFASQGWTLLSSSKSFGHFYKEVTSSYDNNFVYSCQYFIWKDALKKRVSTELWCEPIVSSDAALRLHKDLQINIFNKDRQIFSQLITFDVIHSFASKISPSISDALAAHMQTEDEMRGSVKWMQRTSTFSVPSVLRKSKLLFAEFPCPEYHQHYHPKTHPDNFQEFNSATNFNSQEQKEQIFIGTDISSNALPLMRGRRNNMTSSTNSTTGTRSRTISKFSPIGSPMPSSLRTPPVWQSKKNTECICARPDKLFAAEKDNILRLRSVFRDVALLHYYFEQSLISVTDRTISLNKSSNDDFWSELMNKLFNSNELNINNCTLYAAQNFRDLRCFIKVFDPSMFIVILMPRLDAIVKGLLKLERNARAENEALSFESIGLNMFECRRQISHSQQDCTVNITLMDPLIYKEWYESLSNTSRPKLACGLNSPSSPLSDRALRMIQDITHIYSRSFVKSIFTCLLHGRAVSSEDFTKVLEICDETNIDINLTEYLNVQTLLIHQSRTNKEELMQANQRFISVLGHYFEPVVISNSKWNNVYCYRPPFAKTGQKLGLSLSSGEKPNNLTDVVVYAQNPLFVRLELSLKKPHISGIGFECVTLPVKSLPTSYGGQTEDGASFDFEPESIGTTFSPVDSADGTSATLHLVCMSLPQSEYDLPDTMVTHQAACPVENIVHRQTTFLDIDKSHRAKLSSLSQDKQDALVETEARLNWLFAEEIMHGLLRSGPITQNVVRYVETQLRKKNPFVDFPTNTSIPLAFVKNQKESRRMFLEELEKFSNTHYRLIRTGNCFYAHDNGTLKNLEYHSNNDLLSNDDTKSDCNSLFDGEGLNITTKPDADEALTKLYESEEQEDDEFCQGLGISILESELSGDINNHDEKEGVNESQLYWLLLIPQAQNVQMYFYSKMQQFVDRSEIIRITKSMVNDVINKTNKLSLLQSLNDTRLCSKYLLPSVDEDDEEENFSYDSVASNNNLVEMLSTSGEENVLNPPKKFAPGQFSCDVVYIKRFPLHWRISPNAAYNKLMTDTLPPFLVRNKPGMFVCSHGNSVLYFFLYEANANLQQNANTLSEQNGQSHISNLNNHDENPVPVNPESPYGSSVINSNVHDNDVLGTSQNTRARYSSHTYSKPSPQGSMASQQISPSHSPSVNEISASASSPISGRRHNSRHYEIRELVLEVHGVKVDYYIVDGLVDMIDSRITSEITLKEVQQFLMRNPGSRLSRADINFIMPVEKEPSFRHKLKIPSLINNTAHFLKILKKNILSEASIHPLHSSYAPLFVKRHHEMRYSRLDESDYNRTFYENGQRLPFEDWALTDLLFYYNYLSRAPGTYMPFEQRIGEGVAGICLSVLDDSDIAYSKITSSYPVLGTNCQSSQIDFIAIQQCLTSDFEDTKVDSKLVLAIDIWSYCKIELAYIYHHVQKALKQSVCDYIIESTISNSAHFSRHQQELGGFDFLAKTILYTLDIATEWQSSTAKKISHGIQLAPWYFENILAQLRTELVEIHPSLDPIIAKAEITTKVFMDEAQEQIPNYVLEFDYTGSVGLFQENNDDISMSQTFSLPKSLSKRIAQNKTTRKKSAHVQSQLYNEKTKKAAKNEQYLIFGGIPELHGKFAAPTLQNVRRGSIDISEAPNLNLRTYNRNFVYYGSGGNINPIGEEDIHPAYYASDSQKREDNASLHSRQESLASSVSKAFPNYMLKQKVHSPEQKDVPHQYSFIVLVLDSSRLSVYTYNCSEQLVDHVYNSTYKIIFQQETRHMGLNNILHQKLGLFCHTSGMSEILSRPYQELELTSPFLPIVNSNASLAQHNIISQVQSTINNNNRSLASPNLANTIGRLAHNDSTSSIPIVNNMERRGSNNTTSNSSKQIGSIADFESLQRLIRGTSEQKSRSSVMRNYRSSMEKSLSQALPDSFENSKLYTMTRTISDPAFMTSYSMNADRVLRNACSESIDYKGIGYHTDHLINHGKPYLDSFLIQSRPLAAHEKAFKVYTKWAGHYKEVDEMMTVDELKQILKASRLLHFCRTPHLDLDTKKLSVNTKGSPNQEILRWYEQLAQIFTKEYASYLESIGMHMIVYGPSNNQEDEANAYLSRFMVTDNCFVNSPVVYLLQVFEGGSIMCEVRLTGVFVSVTLYTLHRRYGGLKDSSHFRHQQDGIERESFQSFMAECDRFKQRIHVNSFIFDFQLRQIQRSLDSIESFPSSLNLLNIIKNTIHMYYRPPTYSHNCMVSGTYSFPLMEEPIQGLISWMINNGKAFDMKILKANQTPVALFVSSNDLSFNDYGLTDKGSPFTYTLIIFPKTQTTSAKENNEIISNLAMNSMRNREQTDEDTNDCSSSLHLQYFILVTYNTKDYHSSDKTSVLVQHSESNLILSAELKLNLTMKK
ncbi:hypothetical protein EDC96DRAFT_531823, partial [Choanephora cucurbitarum]